MSYDENEITKRIDEKIEQKQFCSALNDLHLYSCVISADCYNSTLCKILYYLCFALSRKNAFLTEETKNRLKMLSLPTLWRVNETQAFSRTLRVNELYKQYKNINKKHKL